MNYSFMTVLNAANPEIAEDFVSSLYPNNSLYEENPIPQLAGYSEYKFLVEIESDDMEPLTAYLAMLGARNLLKQSNDQEILYRTIDVRSFNWLSGSEHDYSRYLESLIQVQEMTTIALKMSINTLDNAFQANMQDIRTLSSLLNQAQQVMHYFNALVENAGLDNLPDQLKHIKDALDEAGIDNNIEYKTVKLH